MAYATMDGIVPFDQGDYVAFADEDGKVKTGLAHASKDNNVMVHDFNTDKSQQIDPYQVICSAVITDDDGSITVGNLSTKHGTDILGYFRKLYGDNPDFFGKLTRLIRGYSGKVQPTSTNPDINEMLKKAVKSR